METCDLSPSKQVCRSKVQCTTHRVYDSGGALSAAHGLLRKMSSTEYNVNATQEKKSNIPRLAQVDGCGCEQVGRCSDTALAPLVLLT